jgi:hypothetical protein
MQYNILGTVSASYREEALRKYKPLKEKKMTKPRPLTKEEVRSRFLRHLKGVAKYWAGLEGKTPLEKVEGAIFSTLVIFDGESAELPSFIVAPLPNETDKKYYEEQGTNWFPENHNSKVECDIAGNLHHAFRILH